MLFRSALTRCCADSGRAVVASLSGLPFLACWFRFTTEGSPNGALTRDACSLDRPGGSAEGASYRYRYIDAGEHRAGSQAWRRISALVDRVLNKLSVHMRAPVSSGDARSTWAERDGLENGRHPVPGRAAHVAQIWGKWSRLEKSTAVTSALSSQSRRDKGDRLFYR